jgi:anti-anti-sigma factor
MAISYNDLNGGVRHIVLSGRLDFHGVENMIEQFSDLLSSAQADVLVDLAHTTLICSMGIRALILNAKHVQRRGACMALLVDDGTLVSTTLRSVGIDTLLPVYTSLSEAQKSMLK